MNFFKQVNLKLEEEGIIFGIDTTEDEFGRCFWLDRHGHGTGFWDSTEYDSEIGKYLATEAGKFNETHLFIQDGNIYLDYSGKEF